MSAADPLTQLKDIHVPPPVPAWPPAWGWWLLGAFVFTLLTIGIVRLRRQRRRTRAARAAARELNMLAARHAQHGNTRQLVSELSSLLRRAALAYTESSSIARLTGDAWLAWLDTHLGGSDFRQGPGRVLAAGPYQPAPEVDTTALLALCQRWLKRLPEEPRRV